MKRGMHIVIAVGVVLVSIGLIFVTPADAENEEPAEASIVRVMSYNIFRGGTMRGQSLAQTAKVFQAAKADIVGIQETRSLKGSRLSGYALAPGSLPLGAWEVGGSSRPMNSSDRPQSHTT